MKPYGQQIIEFLFHLNSPVGLPDGIETMNPYKNQETQKICTEFYLKYYSDNKPRTFIIGINPGRFGAGITGIPFTDPIRLESECSILNHFVKKQELSSVFIYEMIRSFGGPDEFYSNFYFTSVSPLGFVADGKNLNYYDQKNLQDSLLPFMVESLNAQLEFGSNKHAAICLGGGKNFKFLQKFNEQHKFFNQIIPLPHPRFVMQYRYKKRFEFVEEYLIALKKAISLAESN
ncbi:MAG: DUF4918 family protein [Bacteroidales bacterium]|nr:DUF4918 family protein [Bacteroidales bacterium]